MELLNLQSILGIVVMAVAVVACVSADPEDPSAASGTSACVEMAGVYPPGTVTLVGLERVEVPFTSWECAGYNQDTFEEDLPVFRVGRDHEVVVKVEMRDGAELDVRAVTAGDQVHLDAAVDGDAASVTLPEGTESVIVRMCTADGRCANYEADVGS